MMFLTETLINNSLKNIFEKNISTKKILSRNVAKHTLKYSFRSNFWKHF